MQNVEWDAMQSQPLELFPRCDVHALSTPMAPMTPMTANGACTPSCSQGHGGGSTDNKGALTRAHAQLHFAAGVQTAAQRSHAMPHVAYCMVSHLFAFGLTVPITMR